MKLRDFVAAALSALVVTLVLTFAFSGWLRGLSIDLLFWLRQQTLAASSPAVSPPVVVIAIDEETYRREPFMGVPKAMWTKEFALVLDRVVESGVAVVGFDVIFPTSVEKHIRGFDRGFLLALRRASDRGKVVLAKVQHQLKPIQPYPGYSYAVAHEKNIRAANLFTDEDGIIREAPLWLKREGTASGAPLETTFALEIASRALQVTPRIDGSGRVTIGSYAVPGPNPGRMMLKFDGRAGAIPTYSFGDIYACAKGDKGEFFRSAFAGKVVLFGGVLDVEDRKLTSGRFITRPEAANRGSRCAHPLMGGIYRDDLRRDTVPGAYVQATAIANLLRRDALSEVPPPITAAVGGVLNFLTFLCVLIASPVIVLLTLAVGAGTWVAASTMLFGEGIVFPLLPPLVGALLTAPIAFAYRFAITDRDKRYLRRAFSYYLSPSLVERLIESEEIPKLGGETRFLTAFFSDLEGFTGISETQSPAALVAFLNVYLSELSNIIENKGGIIEKFIADGVAAVFGAPLADPDHPLHAVEAALEIQTRITTLELASGERQAVRTRIGINSGDMLVGNIGSQRRLNYSVMGDAANLASRLEGANKFYGTTILVSERTAGLCGDRIAFREVDTVRVVGRASPVTIFEPIDRADALSEAHAADLAKFHEGLVLYRGRRFADAAAMLGEIADKDPVARVFLARIAGLRDAPLPEAWDGIFDLAEK